MPDITFVPLYDGQIITDTTLDDRFTEVANGINGIMASGIRPGALDTQHFSGSLVQSQGWTSNSGASVLSVGGPGSHNYTTRYVSYGTGGNTDRKVCGSDEVGSGTYDTTNDILFLAHNGVRLGMDQASDVAGILCLYNVEFIGVIAEDESPATSTRLVTSLQYRVNGTWYTLNRSERVCPQRIASVTFSDASTNQDVATVCLLRQTDLTDKGLAANSSVTGIRVMVSVDTNDLGTPQVVLGACRLSILPLHASLV